MTIRPTPLHPPSPAWRRRVIAAPAVGRPAPAGEAVLPPPAAPAARAAATLASRLADRLFGALLGPEAPAYAGQLPGAAGRLANRLGKGQSVLLAATGTAGVPASLLATWLPGGTWLPDVGGSLRMAGMLARKNDGKLLLTLTFQAGEGASRSAGGGLSAGLTLGARRYGFKLGADRGVGGELGQVVVATLKFDPQDPGDARRLADLLAPDLNPFTPSLRGGTALSRALAHNRQAIALGGTAGANLAGTVGGTLGELDRSDGQGVAPDSPWAAKAKLGAAASAGLERFRTWEKGGAVTDMWGLDGGVEGAVKLPALVRGKVSDRVAASFSVTRDAAGLVTGLAATFTDAIAGRALVDLGLGDLGAKAAAKVVRTRALTAAGMEAARALIAAGASPFGAYRRVAQDPALVEEAVVTVGQRTLMAGFDAGLMVGGQKVALTAMFAAGKAQRQARGDEDPGLKELLAVTKGTLFPTLR